MYYLVGIRCNKKFYMDVVYTDSKEEAVKETTKRSGLGSKLVLINFIEEFSEEEAKAIANE